MHKEKMLLKSTNVYSGIQTKILEDSFACFCYVERRHVFSLCFPHQETDETYGIFTSNNDARQIYRKHH